MIIKVAKKDGDKTGGEACEEAAIDSVRTTVTLATRAFDGLDVSDEELDDLCDVTLSNKMQARPKEE